MKVRTATFDQAMRRAGFHSREGLAKAMGVNRSTIGRTLAGEMQPGPAFIAGALTAPAPMTFDDLFTVVTKPDRPATGYPSE